MASGPAPISEPKPPVSIAERIVLLKKAVQAVHEEIHQASDYHEAWRPSVQDQDVRDQMGTSYATNTFEVIRQALRREMVLALLRVWDTNKRALRLSLIGSELQDSSIVEALATEYGDLYLQGQPSFIRHDPDGSPEDRAAIAEAIRVHKKRETALYIESSTRTPIVEALDIIARYQAGGSGHKTLESLRQIRNTRLAHRQIVQGEAPPSPVDDIDRKIDAFFTDMLCLTRLLRMGVQGIDYDPAATAKLQAGYAKLFWRGVRGERTEGHPDYQPPRVRRPREGLPP